MDSTVEQTGDLRRRKRKGNIVLLSLAMLCALILGAYVWIVYIPNWKHIEADFGGNPKPVFYQGTMLKEPAAGSKDTLKLAFDLVQDRIDPAMVYEKGSESTIITTQNKVIRLRTSELTGLINEKPFTLKFPLEKINGQLYMPLEPLKNLYRIELRESEETGAVLLFKAGDTVRWAKVTELPEKPDKTAALRRDPTIKAPIYADLQQGERVMVWGEKGDWYRVQRQNGYIGYIQKKQLTSEPDEMIPDPPPEQPFKPNQPIAGKLNITWEHVVTKNPDTSKIPAMPGLNVVSPTWFHLQDGEGNLQNLADTAYVKWAHSRGYQVWALFSNGFDPKRTTGALSTYDKRMKMTKQLLSFAQMYQLQGINIDFENVSVDDKQNLVQFVREMTPLLHEQGLIVSMDVTPRSSSETWSMFYDRKALIQSIDYMMLMAYDEHWASSPKAGSVASLPWVEKSIQGLLEQDQIPSSKLILGIPFYTRVWTDVVKEGKQSVESKAVFMEMPQRIMREQQVSPQFSTDAGQNYIEYMEDGKQKRIWIEDERSIKGRIDLINKYDLAGVASWRRGFEVPEAWTWIHETLK